MDTTTLLIPIVGLLTIFLVITLGVVYGIKESRTVLAVAAVTKDKQQNISISNTTTKSTSPVKKRAKSKSKKKRK